MSEMLFDQSLARLTDDLCALLSAMPEPQRIEALNAIRLKLHAVSPFAAEPVDCVLWLRADAIVPNDYNPNTIPPPEMRLLEKSIKRSGVTMPIHACPAPEGKHLTIDGEHRTRVCRDSKTVRARLKGYAPVTLAREDQRTEAARILATNNHNDARGGHGVVPVTENIARLVRAGLTDAEIATELGKSADEVLRFRNRIGLPELFKNHEYSKAWE